MFAVNRCRRCLRIICYLFCAIERCWYRPNIGASHNVNVSKCNRYLFPSMGGGLLRFVCRWVLVWVDEWKGIKRSAILIAGIRVTLTWLESYYLFPLNFLFPFPAVRCVRAQSTHQLSNIINTQELCLREIMQFKSIVCRVWLNISSCR